MRHAGNAKFWAAYEKLPPSVRKLADKSFELLKSDPEHPSLHLKQLAGFGQCASVLNTGRLAFRKMTPLFGFGLEHMLNMIGW